MPNLLVNNLKKVLGNHSQISTDLERTQRKDKLMASIAFVAEAAKDSPAKAAKYGKDVHILFKEIRRDAAAKSEELQEMQRELIDTKINESFDSVTYKGVEFTDRLESMINDLQVIIDEDNRKSYINNLESIVEKHAQFPSGIERTQRKEIIMTAMTLVTETAKDSPGKAGLYCKHVDNLVKEVLQDSSIKRNELIEIQRDLRTSHFMEPVDKVLYQGKTFKDVLKKIDSDFDVTIMKASRSEQHNNLESIVEDLVKPTSELGERTPNRKVMVALQLVTEMAKNTPAKAGQYCENVDILFKEMIQDSTVKIEELQEVQANIQVGASSNNLLYQGKPFTNMLEKMDSDISLSIKEKVKEMAGPEVDNGPSPG
jgi:hypothetical protein